MLLTHRDEYGMSIASEHLKSFDLNSLQGVSTGTIYIDTENSCYANRDVLIGIFKRPIEFDYFGPEIPPYTCGRLVML